MAYDDRTEQPRTLGFWNSGGNWTILFTPESSVLKETVTRACQGPVQGAGCMMGLASSSEGPAHRAGVDFFSPASSLSQNS